MNKNLSVKEGRDASHSWLTEFKLPLYAKLLFPKEKDPGPPAVLSVECLVRILGWQGSDHFLELEDTLQWYCRVLAILRIFNNRVSLLHVKAEKNKNNVFHWTWIA